MFKFDGRHKIQGLVGPLGVVVVHPLLDELARVGQGPKQVGVEQLTAKRAIEALNVGVLGRFTRLNQVQVDALLFTPIAEPGADEFWPVIGAQLRRATMALN